MGAKFISLRTSPISRLTFRGLVYGLLVLLLAFNPGSFWAGLAFIAVALTMYLQPTLRSITFGASFIALILLPFLLPPLPLDRFLIAGLMGLAFAILWGVKNLELIERKGWYTFMHLLLLASYGAIIIASDLSILSEIIGFILLFALFREFYNKVSVLRGNRLLLVSGVMSLLSLELLAVLTLLPIGFVAGAVIFALFSCAAINTYLNQLDGRFSTKLLLRNVTLLTLSSLLVMAFSSWTLY
ncbi:hypothetical protein M1295_02315 [Patescibacteria group bacterium]|nr:hypothetical protein [Patescibacteria group bacterium]